jgi:hypothetical protein
MGRIEGGSVAKHTVSAEKARPLADRQAIGPGNAIEPGRDRGDCLSPRRNKMVAFEEAGVWNVSNRGEPMRNLFAIALFALAACNPAGNAPGKLPAPPEDPDAPKGEAIADPVLREARDQADEILAGLIAGKFDLDQELGLLPKKVKGYQSFSIKSQSLLREGAAEFTGVFRSPTARAVFRMDLVKQKSGKWAIGAFSGPNPE